MTQTVILTCDSCGVTTQTAVDAWSRIDVEAEGRAIPRLRYQADLCPRCNRVFVDQFPTVMAEAMRQLGGKKREAA